MNGQKEKEQQPKEDTVYKFSNKGLDQLKESCIIETKPYFQMYHCNEEKNQYFIQVHEKITGVIPVLRPPLREEYPYEPYEYKTLA